MAVSSTAYFTIDYPSFYNRDIMGLEEIAIRLKICFKCWLYL